MLLATPLAAAETKPASAAPQPPEAQERSASMELIEFLGGWDLAADEDLARGLEVLDPPTAEATADE